MDEDCALPSISDPPLAASGTESQVLIENDSVSKFVGGLEPPGKRVKMQHLSIAEEGIYNHSSEVLPNKEAIGSVDEIRSSKETLTVNSSAARGEKVERQATQWRTENDSGSLDLNNEASTASQSGKTGYDINPEDASSLVNKNPIFPSKILDNLKSRSAASECGSSSGPLDSEAKDPLRVWKEMKQNGFLSSSHGGIPVPKLPSKRIKNDALKKKMEFSKKDQVSRFAKLAAPSKLLSDLNPGIINHVRNSKQVHSIIEALVKSEKLENQRAESNRMENQSQIRFRETIEHTNESERNHQKAGYSNSLNKQIRGCPMSLKNAHLLSSVEKYDQSSKFPSMNIKKQETEDDILELKLSSSTNMGPPGLTKTSSLSKEELPNTFAMPSVTMKAAMVASQWLDLQHQDVKGRLAALRRSKKRVRSAILTELPFLMAKEFSSTQEIDPPHTLIKSVPECSNNADLHHTSWCVLFDQMDKELSEEEKDLENWLNQVKDMQMHCRWGLQRVPWNPSNTLHHLGRFVKDFRSDKEENMERELAVQAAAASIYATCNFLSSNGNMSVSDQA